MPLNNSGIQTKCDNISINESIEELKKVVSLFQNESVEKLKTIFNREAFFEMASSEVVSISNSN